MSPAAGSGNFSLGTVPAEYAVIMFLVGVEDKHMKLIAFALNPREIRHKLGLNQQDFWTRIGVTQSGGSRYESGRSMPKPVRELLRLVHVERVDLSRVRKEDFEVLEHLRSTHPQFYQSLRKSVRSKSTRGNGATR